MLDRRRLWILVLLMRWRDTYSAARATGRLGLRCWILCRTSLDSSSSERRQIVSLIRRLTGR